VGKIEDWFFEALLLKPRDTSPCTYYGENRQFEMRVGARMVEQAFFIHNK
jgi:hypothetical protein